MPAPPNPLNVVRLVSGQTKVLKVTVKTDNGRAKNLDGSVVYFTAREKIDSAVLISKKSPDDGIVISDAAQGEAIITLSTTDTVLAQGHYLYDIWVEIPGEPPVRYPVVKKAELFVESSLTDFS